MRLTTQRSDYFHPAEKEAYTLRLLLSFIAKDLGLDDNGRVKHKLELTREIRAAIAKAQRENKGRIIKCD